MLQGKGLCHSWFAWHWSQQLKSRRKNRGCRRDAFNVEFTECADLPWWVAFYFNSQIKCLGAPRQAHDYYSFKSAFVKDWSIMVLLFQKEAHEADCTETIKQAGECRSQCSIWYWQLRQYNPAGSHCTKGSCTVCGSPPPPHSALSPTPLPTLGKAQWAEGGSRSIMPWYLRVLSST